MTFVNLTAYETKPLILQFGKWKITSEPPSGKALKAMKGILAYSAQIAVISEAALRAGDDSADALSRVEISDDVKPFEDVDVTVLTLGAEEVERLENAGCPVTTLERAGMYALIYWATGESTLAANEWLQTTASGARPKGPAKRMGNKNGRKR